MKNKSSIDPNNDYANTHGAPAEAKRKPSIDTPETSFTKAKFINYSCVGCDRLLKQQGLNFYWCPNQECQRFNLLTVPGKGSSDE